MARLGDVFDLQMGKTPARANPEYWTNGENAWVSIADLSSYDKYVGETKEQITDLAVQESGIKLVPADTVIMSFKLSIGKTAITKAPIYTNEAIMAFLPTGKYDVCTDYFYHLFSGRDWSQGTNRAVMGATLNKATLSTLEIDVPPMEEQRRIAALLDKVSDLIANRRAQLDKLDLLVKAKFVEMFENGPKSEKILLGDISEFVTVGIANSATHAYAKSGVVMLRNQNIKENHLDDNDLVFIKKEFADKYNSKSLKENDILVTRTGYPGVACLVPAQYEGAQTFTTLIVRLKKSVEIHPNFICHYINSSYGKAYVEGEKVGVAQQNFGAKVLALMPIVIPEVKLQNDFTDFCIQIDKLKTSVKDGLDKLGILKEALMQQYFG